MIPVLFDCDPGHDDAIALVLAHASDKIDIKAVTTTAGNQTVEKTALNAQKIMTFLGSGVPVAKGCSSPLFRDLIIAPEVHGETGLDGPELPEPAQPLSELHAVELMAKVVRESDEKITIIATGALTNVALFLKSYPALKEKIERISLMGGSAVGGNWTPAAEFNILVDPEAASIVYNSGIPVIMSGLDVTHKALIKKEDTERFRAIGTKTAVMVAELLDFFAKFHDDNFDFGGSPLHDPCAVAYLIAPELFESVHCHVDIETKGSLSLGATVADLNLFSDLEKNVRVLTGINRSGFVDLLADHLGRLN